SPSIHDYAVACATGMNTLTLDLAAIPGGAVSLSGPIVTGPAPSASVTVTLAEDQAAVIQATDGNGLTEDYWLRCLPHDFPLVTANAHPENGTPAPGLYLIDNTFVSQGMGKFAMIVDVNGTPIWYHRTQGAAVMVEPLPDSTIGITTISNPVTGTL